MKLLLKWLLSIAIGVFFVWLAARSWPLEQIFAFELRLEGSYLVAGDVSPEEIRWYPPSPSDGAAGVNRGVTVADKGPIPNGWAFNLLYLIPYGIILSLIHVLRVLRWYPLLRPITKVSFWRLNRIGAVGFMCVFLFPLRLGEFVRPYLIAERGRIRMSEAMGTIVVERVLDGLLTSLMLFIVLRYLPSEHAQSYTELRAGSYIALSVFVLGTALLTMAYARRDRTVATIRKILGRLMPGMTERLIGILESFIRGLSALPSFRNLALFVGTTLLYWGMNGFGLYVFARGFGMHVPLLAAYAMMASVVVGMMIPNSPANVGSFWFFLLKPLELFGVGATSLQATAAALGIWLVQLIQLLLFGGYFLLVGTVSFKTVWASTKDSPTDALLPSESTERL